MATLTGNKVKDSYQSLLKLSSGGSTSTIKTVQDGLGVSTGLKLSTTAVEVNTLKITETPTSSSSELTVLVYDDTTKEVRIPREVSLEIWYFEVAENPQRKELVMAELSYLNWENVPVDKGML